MTNAVLYAYILDLIFGDPHWFPHPVRLLGYTIKNLETPFRKFFPKPKLAGVFFAFTIIGATGLITWFLVFRVMMNINIHLFTLLSVLLIYTSISVKDLKDEVTIIYQALKDNNLVFARERLSRIVGRDTAGMDAKDIIRATIESIAESTVDGIIAPVFYAFIGGAPMVLIYKAVNTLDSMVGYCNRRYRDFGWASAKIDDVFNFLPARLSAIIMSIAGFLAGKDCMRALKTVIRDGRKNPSPNSGISEAAVAGALGIQLGGVNYYQKRKIHKPLIGDSINGLDIKHIREALRIAYMSAFVSVVFGCVVYYLTGKSIL